LRVNAILHASVFLPDSFQQSGGCELLQAPLDGARRKRFAKSIDEILRANIRVLFNKL
jgi:hypothetical protein